MLSSVDSEAAKRIVQLRIELSKTSVKKYTAMINAAGRGNRVRGILQHYGASRTGRWSGRLIQVQNLPRGGFKDIEVPRELVRAGDAELLEMCYGAIPDTLSSLIRSTLIPEKGKKLFISDFSAIEARVIAWVAGEQWRIDVFNTHGKIYEASAAQMFKVPLESIGKDSPLRQKGKVAELALGYQGGPNALLKMGALDMGIPENELKGLVDAWRGANKKIVAFWKTVNSAALNTLRTGEKTSIGKGMYFSTARGWLFLTLPSGRKLSYPNAGYEEGEYGDKIFYWGMNQTTKKWCKIDSYGGKFVENLVQAIARDCLAFGLLNVAKAGYTIIMHVHDEVVCEDTHGSIEEVNALLAQNPDWAEGLPLKAEGCESYYYKK
jgi:DNA polymerase